MARKQSTQKSSNSQNESEGRFCYDGLDRAMHEKARLGIMASLAANTNGLSFNDLKQLCSLTDGNLSRHISVLSEADLVKTLKTGGGSRQQTTYQLTKFGRERFADYLAVLESIISDAQLAEQKLPARTARTQGLSTA